MSQHFLLSSKSRKISVKKIASMSEAECYDYFKSSRLGLEYKIPLRQSYWIWLLGTLKYV